MELKPDLNLYLHTLGKRFRITAIFHSDADANAYMERTPGASVIAAHDPYVFIADKNDAGEKATTSGNSQSDIVKALDQMWTFASKLVERHGMNGDDTMTDADHAEWQEAAGAMSVALDKANK